MQPYSLFNPDKLVYLVGLSLQLDCSLWSPDVWVQVGERNRTTTGGNSDGKMI